VGIAARRGGKASRPVSSEINLTTETRRHGERQNLFTADERGWSRITQKLTTDKH
jgi:hypothetical protein